MEVVYKSKKENDKKSIIAATNAITILNISHYSFSGKDLSKVKIPNAELAGGEFVNTNFSDADLSGVNLRSTLLTQA